MVAAMDQRPGPHIVGTVGSAEPIEEQSGGRSAPRSLPLRRSGGSCSVEPAGSFKNLHGFGFAEHRSTGPAGGRITKARRGMSGVTRPSEGGLSTDSRRTIVGHKLKPARWRTSWISYRRPVLGHSAQSVIPFRTVQTHFPEWRKTMAPLIDLLIGIVAWLGVFASIAAVIAGATG